MVLNNFAKMCAGAAYSNSGNNIIYTNEAGSSWTYNYNIAEAFKTQRARDSYYGSGDSGVTIVLGTGNTAPTKTDYALESDITTTLTYLSGVTSPLGDGVIGSVTQNYQNNTSSAVTIREIGLLLGVAYQWQGGGFVLVTRKVLDNPVTIQPGKTYSFNITISLN